MANRIISNVLIVDSAAGNSFIVDTISNSTGQIRSFYVNSISFWSANTTGLCQISCGADTTDVVIQFSWLYGTTAAFQPAHQSTSFGQKQLLEQIKVPTLTAGTAWLYLV